MAVSKESIKASSVRAGMFIDPRGRVSEVAECRSDANLVHIHFHDKWTYCIARDESLTVVL